jgi:dipeptidyl aminopeptidase/acylaminoacyl peptidase
MVKRDSSQRVQLTSSPDNETAPRWSPDRTYLSFVASRGTDEEKKRGGQVWLLNRAGGEAQKLTDVKGGISDYSWSPDNNYGLDDRRAIRHVQTLRRSGDVVLTTHLGLAALWWYGGVNIADVDGGTHFEDSPVFEISHQTDARVCDQAAETLNTLSSRASRLIVYLGFRMNVLPEGFDRFALEELSRRGALVAYNKYADLSYVAAFDMREQAGAGVQRWLADVVAADGPPLPGCLVVRPARRW